MTKKTVSKTEKNTYRYGLQETFCKLYADSKENKPFKHLMKYIIAEDNIVLHIEISVKTTAVLLPVLTEK